MRPTVRDPVAAGTSYPALAEDLSRELERLLDEVALPNGVEPAPTRLLVAPHAALTRSGVVAARAHVAAQGTPLVVILAPNHHRVGAPLALPRSGSWRTPLGTLEIEPRATQAMFAAAGPGLSLRDDWRAHSRDHATEMQLPFLQMAARRREGAAPRLVTLACAERDLRALIAAGDALASALLSLRLADASDALLLVSANLSQGLPAADVRDEDQRVLDVIVRCEPEELFALVSRRGIVLGGLPPLIVGLAAARRLGAGQGEILAHETSAQRGGDAGQAVGYAAIRLPPG